MQDGYFQHENGWNLLRHPITGREHWTRRISDEPRADDRREAVAVAPAPMILRPRRARNPRRSAPGRFRGSRRSAAAAARGTPDDDGDGGEPPPPRDRATRGPDHDDVVRGNIHRVRGAVARCAR
jgi:hypothetical protein